MKTLLSLLFLLFAFSAHAQVYKCKVNGKTEFKDQPCETEGQALRLPAQPTEAEQMAARRRSDDDARELRRMDAENKSQQYRRASESARADYERERKDRECAQLQRIAQSGGARAQDAKAEHFSRCYGSNRN